MNRVLRTLRRWVGNGRAVDKNGDRTIWNTVLDRQLGVWNRAREKAAGPPVKDSTGRDEKPDVFPVLFPLLLQKAIFNECVYSTEIKTQRDILDCYMTSYFNAWLDNHNLHGHSKKFVTAFVSDMNMREASIDSFFEIYPDGRSISIVREPKSWFVSARKHSKDYRKLENQPVSESIPPPLP